MEFFGLVEYQPEWVQKLAKHHAEDPVVIAIYPQRQNVDPRFPGRDRLAEQIAALKGLWHYETSERHGLTRLITPIPSITEWTGRDIHRQNIGSEIVGAQFMTIYTVIVFGE